MCWTRLQFNTELTEQVKTCQQRALGWCQSPRAASQSTSKNRNKLQVWNSLIGWLGNGRDLLTQTYMVALSLCIIHIYHWTLLFLILWRKEPPWVHNTGRNKYMKSIRMEYFLKMLYNQSDRNCIGNAKKIHSAAMALKQATPSCWTAVFQCPRLWS